jgi:hypothetical protein
MAIYETEGHWFESSRAHRRLGSTIVIGVNPLDSSALKRAVRRTVISDQAPSGRLTSKNAGGKTVKKKIKVKK